MIELQRVKFNIYTRSEGDVPTSSCFSKIYLRSNEALHIPGLGFDGLFGYSPMPMANNAVGMAISTEEYGANPGVVRETARVRERWNSVYKGSTNAHRVVVLEDGMKFKSIGSPPGQAQFLQTRKFQLNEIVRLFRIPPHMIGDLEKSSFSNIEQQSLEFVKYTLDSWVIIW